MNVNENENDFIKNASKLKTVGCAESCEFLAEHLPESNSNLLLLTPGGIRGGAGSQFHGNISQN